MINREKTLIYLWKKKRIYELRLLFVLEWRAKLPETVFFLHYVKYMKNSLDVLEIFSKKPYINENLYKYHKDCCTVERKTTKGLKKTGLCTRHAPKNLKGKWLIRIAIRSQQYGNKNYHVVPIVLNVKFLQKYLHCSQKGRDKNSIQFRT